jgi:uncharacterized protein YpiB (UPF0302 family)
MARMRILTANEQELFDNPREYTQTEKEEQEIAEACNRLIKNSIICWNYLYLVRQIEKAPDTESKKT